MEVGTGGSDPQGASGPGARDAITTPPWSRLWREARHKRRGDAFHPHRRVPSPSRPSAAVSGIDASHIRPPRVRGGRMSLWSDAMRRKVVCASDATWRSALVMAVADELAGRARLPLEVVHATQAVGERTLGMRAHRIGELIRESTGRTDIPLLVERGYAMDCLVRATGGASLLVMGATRRRPLWRPLHPGLVATVARRAACPVVAVPLRCEIPCAGSRVLCGVRDERDLATAADAAYWARALDLELTLVSVVNPPRPPLVAGVGVVPPIPAMTVRESLAAAERHLAELAETIRPVVACDVVVELAAAPAGRALRRMASRCDAALLALGASARPLVAGAVTRSVLRDGDRPVMLMPRPADAVSAWMASSSHAHSFEPDAAP